MTTVRSSKNCRGRSAIYFLRLPAAHKAKSTLAAGEHINARTRALHSSHKSALRIFWG